MCVKMHDYYYPWYHPYGWHSRHYGLYDGGAFIFFLALVFFVLIGLTLCLPWDMDRSSSHHGYWKWVAAPVKPVVEESKKSKDVSVDKVYVYDNLAF